MDFFLAFTFLGFGLLSLAALILVRESGIRMGPVAISSGTILGAIFLTLFTLEWDLWVVILINTLGGLLWLLIQVPERKALQKRQEERAKTIHNAVLNGEDAPRFALFLRSFDSQGTLMAQDTQSIGHKHDFEEVLALAIERDGWSLVAAGTPSKEVGAARVEMLEEGWRHNVACLIRKAAIVFLLPNQNKGTWWEIAFIVKNDYVFKTVFIMPETILTYSRPGGGGITVTLDEWEGSIPENWREAGRRPHRRLWEETREAMARCFGVHLPKYDSGGALVALGRNSGQSCVRTLHLHGTFLRVRRMRRAVNKMFAHMGPPVNTR